MAGVLKDVLVERGSVVRKGDVIARLESGVEEASLALAKARAANDAVVQARQARVDFLFRKHNRLERLQSTNVASVASVDEVETELRLARFELNEAQLNQQLSRLEETRAAEVLKQRGVESPMDGLVIERALSRGEYAYEQAHIVTIAQLNPLNVEMFAPTAYFGSIRVGMNAEVRPEEPVGGVYSAKVHVVDGVFDQRSGTFGVRLKLDNPEHKLPAGIRCKIRFLNS